MKVIKSHISVGPNGRAMLDVYRELPPGNYEVVLIVGDRSESNTRTTDRDLSMYAPDVLFDDIDAPNGNL